LTGVARNLLAVLARSPGQLVPVDEVAVRLWGDEPPEAAEKAIAAYAARLRKAIADAAPAVDPQSVLPGDDSGYALAIEPSNVDLIDFERLLAEGQRALSVGQPVLAVDRLTAALDLWRGNTRADLGSQPYVRAEAARLNQLRMTAIESRVQAQLAVAAPSVPTGLVDELRRQVEEHPHRERLWGLLMTALHRLGRRADALAVYQEACTRLTAGNAQPGAELRSIERGVRAGDPALDGNPLTHAELPLELAAPLPECVGRDEELAWLQAALDHATLRRGQARLVVGTTGIGKTRLMAELAQRAARRGVTVRYARAAATADALVAEPDQVTLVVVDDLDQAGRDDVANVASFIRATSARPVLTVIGATDIVRVGELGGLPKVVLSALADAAIAELVRSYAPGTTDATAVTAMANASGVPARLHRVASEWAFARAGRRIDRAVADAAEPRRWLGTVRDEVTAGVLDLEYVRSRARALRHTTRDTALRPWLGLARYERGDAELMHGRERLVAELVARLVAAPVAALVGPSGSGKSSLLRAGLLPALAAGVLPDSGQRRQLLVTPSTAGDLAAALAPGPELPGLVVVDQFEEVFTAPDPALRIGLAEGLAAAVAAGLSVVIAVRSEHYPRCAELPILSRLITDNTVLVTPMTTDELRHVIERPAALAGLSIEDGLTGLILADMAAIGADLTQLSTALRLLWQRRAGQMLTSRAYREIGGVPGAVESMAESAYAAVPAAARDAARRLLPRLVDADGVPVRIARADLAGPAASVVQALAPAGVLRLDDDSVEIAHESLGVHWPRLRAWLEEDRVARQVRQRLTTAASAWAASGSDPATLYRGPRLAAAVSWVEEHPGDLSGVEGAFLAASRDASRGLEERRAHTIRRLWQALAIAILIIALIVTAGVLVLTRQHRAGATGAHTEAVRLGALALAESDVRRALLLAVAAVRIDDTPATRGALLSVLLRNPDLVAANGVGAGDRATAFVLSPDGMSVAVASRDGPIRLFDAASLREIARLDQSGHRPIGGLAFTPDGRRLVSWGGPRAWTDPQTQPPSIVVWDLATGRPAGPAFGEAFPDGGGLLLDGVTLVVGQRSASGRLSAAAWNIDSRTPSTAYPLPTLDVRGLQVSGDGRWVVTTTGSGSVVLDAHTGESRMLAGVPVGARPSPDGSSLLTPDGADIAIWAAADGRRRGTARGPGPAAVLAVAWAPDGRGFASAGADGSVLLWDAATLRVRRSLTIPTGDGPVNLLTYGRDGRTLYAGTAAGGVLALDGTGTRGIELRLREASVRPRTGVGMGPAAGQYVYRDAEGAHVYDPGTGRDAVKALEVGSPAALTTAGAYLAAAYPDGSVRAWDLRTGRSLAGDHAGGGDGPAHGLAGAATAGGLVGWSVAVDAGGTRLALGLRALDGSGEIRLLDPASGQAVGGPVPVGRLDSGLALSPDAHLLAVGDGEQVRVLSLGDARPVAALALGPVRALTFSADGRWLLAADATGVATLVATDGWRPVWTVPGMTGSGLALLGGPAVRVALTGSDGRIVAFDADADGWLSRACGLAGRDLGLAQWQQLLPGRSYQPVCPDQPA
jgi:WD40 repeat protein/DNA-binding SARP family transcriptional activator